MVASPILAITHVALIMYRSLQVLRDFETPHDLKDSGMNVTYRATFGNKLIDKDFIERNIEFETRTTIKTEY